MFNRLLAALALTTSALASPSQAADQPRSAHISFSDLDLSREAGRATLTKRVRQATKDVCALEVPASLHAKRLERRCEMVAWDGAADRVAAVTGAASLQRIARR